MPIYKMSSHDRRQQKNRQIESWMKWAAIVLSATLLATTLLLVHARWSLNRGVALPQRLEIGKSVIAR